MKAFFSAIFFACLSSAAYSAQNQLLLDAACSYDCVYVAEKCYDGCWDAISTRKKYVDFTALTLEQIEQKKSSKELAQVCLKELPALEQWETNVKFSKISNFDCQFFKH